MHFLQRMVAKAVSEALTQAMNRKLQKQTDELVQENEDSTGGAYHFLDHGSSDRGLYFFKDCKPEKDADDRIPKGRNPVYGQERYGDRPDTVLCIE